MNEQRLKRTVEILLVEDSPTDRLMTLRAIQESRILTTMHSVENGVDAMAFLRREGRFIDAPRPDLVLLDLNLPKMDGREVLAQVKADRQLRFIPIIVLSTSKADEDVLNAYSEYVNGYITKPVDLAQFGHALSSLGNYWFEVVTLPSTGAVERLSLLRKDVSTSHMPVPGGRTRVLLVEDSQTDALLVTHALTSSTTMKFEVRHVHRLSEAKPLLETEYFDVVLTDLSLPDSRGLETYNRIQSFARAVPVVVLTGVEDEETGLKALRLGAQEYLLKGEHSGPGLARAIRYAIDRKNTQAQLLQSQRLEAVGQLSGGMAHDFNNLLTVVQANSSLIESIDASAEVHELAAEIRQAAERGAALTRQLLAFSRKQVMQPRVVDLNEVVTTSAKMLRRIIGNVKIELHLKSGMPAIEADVGMLEQVLMNLAVNARDAMPEGGKLRLETDHRRIAPEEVNHLNPRAYAGEFVSLSVRDTGSGIPAEILEKIWEPFFTTKGTQKGTGLGLSTVIGIVEQHRGWVTVSSAVGAGTVFDIVLPVTGQAQAPVVLENKSPARKFATGAKTVLVVDDENAVQALVHRVLTRAGYTVLRASSAEEGLAVWLEEKGKIDLVLTDITMPGGMTGLALARRLRERDPAVRVLFTSGFFEEALGAEHGLVPGANFLEKPYSTSDLLRVVAKVLE